MANIHRKLKRAQERKYGHLHEKKPQHTKLNVSGTILAGLSSITSGARNAISTTSNSLSHAARVTSSSLASFASISKSTMKGTIKGLVYTAEAIKENPETVVIRTLIGAASGATMGLLCSKADLQLAQENKFGENLKELAKSNSGCEFGLEARPEGPPRPYISCAQNKTLEYALSAQARIDMLAVIPSIMPYAKINVPNGAAIAAISGLLCGIFGALEKKYDKDLRARIEKDRLTPVELITCAKETKSKDTLEKKLSASAYSLFRKLGSGAYPGGELHGIFQGFAVSGGLLFLCNLLKMERGLSAMIFIASLFLPAWKQFFELNHTEPLSDGRFSSKEMVGALLGMLAIDAPSFANMIGSGVLLPVGLVSLASDLHKIIINDLFIEDSKKPMARIY